MKRLKRWRDRLAWMVVFSIVRKLLIEWQPLIRGPRGAPRPWNANATETADDFGAFLLFSAGVLANQERDDVCTYCLTNRVREMPEKHRRGEFGRPLHGPPTRDKARWR